MNIKILLDKFEAYRIRSCALNWFKTCLSSRIQRVRIDDTTSEPIEVIIVIPQGSVLGGLLFLVYINGFPRVSESLITVLFADDTCISLSNDIF